MRETQLKALGPAVMGGNFEPSQRSRSERRRNAAAVLAAVRENDLRRADPWSRGFVLPLVMEAKRRLVDEPGQKIEATPTRR
jgi:hypothetical protein